MAGNVVLITSALALTAIPFMVGSGKWHIHDGLRTIYGVAFMVLFPVLFLWYVLFLAIGGAGELVPVTMVLLVGAFVAGWLSPRWVESGRADRRSE